MEVKRDILWRVYLCFLGIVVLSFLVLGKAIFIQTKEGAFWKSMSDSLHQKVVETEAERGTIYSEDGSMLSTSIPYFDIYIDFGADGLREKNGKRFKDNIDSLSIALAKFFKDKSSKEYKQELQKGYRSKDRYYLFKKNLSFEDYKVLRNFPLIKTGKNRSGFIADVKSKRLNPFGLLANRTIGLARQNAQNVGLERTYDSLLKGETGKRLVRFVGAGAYVPVEGYEIEPKNGKDIITTIDVNIQDIAENALLKMMIENEAEHGTCIVMEVKTGKIKAIANLGKQGENYSEDLNYAIRGSEPGSTFKLATMIALLEDGYVKMDDQVNLEGGTWKVSNRTVYDSEKHGLTNVTVKEAFEHSSNVGMAKLAWAYYSKNPKKFIGHLQDLHLHQQTGVDLMGETNPIIKNPKSRTWSATTLPWMAFGYEVLVSPLQTLMLYNAVANNGKMMKPYLVNEIHQSGVAIQKKEPTVLEERICSDNTLNQLKQCLEGVMTAGTGKELNTPLYTIAGKTGTALVANGRFGYRDHIYQSSFAGYFPADNPQYSCIVVVKNKPFAKKFYGALVAGPVFREVADKLVALNSERISNNSATAGFSAKPDSSAFYYAGHTSSIRNVFKTMNVRYKDSAGKAEWSRVYAENFQSVVNEQKIPARSMPNVKGMGLKDALYLLENLNVKVMVKGKGKVRSQSLEPGANFQKNQIVTLELN